MMLLHSTALSSTFGAHPHPKTLLHLNLMNSMPQWMSVTVLPPKS